MSVLEVRRFLRSMAEAKLADAARDGEEARILALTQLLEVL